MTNEIKNLRLAVLIDAENVPRNSMKAIMEEAAIYGTPTIKRIYGDWTSPNVASWKSLLLENAVTPIQQYSYTTGKNSTDSAMIIDASSRFSTMEFTTGSGVGSGVGWGVLVGAAGVAEGLAVTVDTPLVGDAEAAGLLVWPGSGSRSFRLMASRTTTATMIRISTTKPTMTCQRVLLAPEAVFPSRFFFAPQ